MQMLGARGTGAPRRGQMWGGRRAGAAVCVAAAAVTPGTPKAGQATGPRGAGSGRRALLAGPEQAGLTLPTPPPSSRPRLPTAMPTGPGGRGRPGGEHEMRPATAEARSGPAPDLSPLSPDARAGRGRCQGGLWVAPCGWAGAAGQRGRGGAGPGSPEGRRRPGAGRSGAGGRAGVAGYLRSGTGSLSEHKSVLSPNNTRWPTRRHAGHVTARSPRPAGAPPPARPGPAPSPAPPPCPPAPPASHGILRCRRLPPLSPPDTPLPGPRMSGWRGRGGGRAQAPAGPRVRPPAGASCPSLRAAGSVSSVGPGPSSPCGSPSSGPHPEPARSSESSAPFDQLAFQTRTFGPRCSSSENFLPACHPRGDGEAAQAEIQSSFSAY